MIMKSLLLYCWGGGGGHCFRSVCPSQKFVVQLLLHVKRKFFKGLHACLLPYTESHIVTSF